jgi:hypothetical protein
MSWPPVKVQIPEAKEVLRQIVHEGRQINPKPQTQRHPSKPLVGPLRVPPSVVLKDWLGFDSAVGGGVSTLWSLKCIVPGCDSGHAITINSRKPDRGQFCSPVLDVDPVLYQTTKEHGQAISSYP